MSARRELVILVADGTMAAVFRTFFERAFHHALGCARFDFDPNEDVVHDPLSTDGGVHVRAHEILRQYLKSHQRALVVLDRQFGGERPSEEIRREIERRLHANGWAERQAAALVIDPELEVWLWQDNVHVDRALCHRGTETLRGRLAREGSWPTETAKPEAPKELMQQLIRQNRAGPPMMVYSEIVRRVSVAGCTDRAFLRLRRTLQSWFPVKDG